MFETDLQKVQFLDKYSRWNEEKGRRETWEETVDRVIAFLGRKLFNHGGGAALDAIDFEALRKAMLDLEVLPSMRVVQMAGPALERCNVGAYNCSYLPLKDWQAFSELLYILMQGTGVGFSVEQQYIDQLPVIKPQTGYMRPEPYVIEDTTEGWCNALQQGLSAWSNGEDIVFDYSKIRPYGAPLKTKGGKASGPEPLRNLLDFARKLLLAHQGRKLSSLNAHDLACYCGSIVQVGGVRRAAEISLSDRNDTKMAHAKTGRFYEQFPERSMANNSVVYNVKPSVRDFMDDWRNLMESGTGERGIFNRGGVNTILSNIGSYRQPHEEWGLNPCGEIILRPFEFCNLSIAVARPNDTPTDLARKVRLATQFGVVQSLLTDFQYIRPEWKKNCEEERLLGVDITGQMDNPYLNGIDGETRDKTYEWLWANVRVEAERLAEVFKINIPAAVTCVKPSGNSSQLLDCSSGLHPRYAPYYIRRIRLGASSPIAKLLIESGVPHSPEVGQPPDNPTVWVFEFPVKSPKGAITRHNVSAIDQLEQWKSCKEYYTEHNPSITVYVREDEWLRVGSWVYDNWDIVGGISFLPWDGGVYMLAPYEEISKETYNAKMALWPTIDFKRLQEMEHTDNTTVNQEYACVGGVCEL